MQLVDERAIARGMIRVSPGEDLVESLEALASAAGWQEAFVTGAGILELVELQAGEGIVTLENAELISLSGRLARRGEAIEMALRAVVAAGGTIVTGRIRAAMTGGLILVVDAIGEIGAAAPKTAPTPRPAPVAPEPARRSDPVAVRNAVTPPSQQFSSRPIARPISSPDLGDEDDEDNPSVDVGDILEHPQLGRCDVVGHDNSGGVQVRLTSGKVRVLRLDALQVLAGREDAEGRMTFKIAGPRRRRSRF